MYGLSKYIMISKVACPSFELPENSDHAGSTQQGLRGSSSTTSTRTAWTKRKFSDNWNKWKQAWNAYETVSTRNEMEADFT